MKHPIVHLRKLDARGWSRYAAPIASIERNSFSAASRDSSESMHRIVDDPRGVCYVALLGGTLAGYCLGGPLENFSHLPGIDRDPELGAADSLYAAILAVSQAHRGQGVAGRLKRAQIVGARAMGYRRVTGRNRCGTAEVMWHLNRRLGARALGLVRGAYEDGPEPRDCVYYEIELDAVPADTAPARTLLPTAPA